MNRPRRNRRRAGGLLLVMAALLVAVGALPAMAAAKDGNGDRIPDKWEKRHHLSLQVKQTHRDQDHDHLGNRAEFLAGDNPRDRDSDNDGVLDGNENAGKIASFDATTGKLTIELFGGDSISGLVTESTRIKCENESDVAQVSSEEESSDDNGDAEAEPGDDNGGAEGDDNGDASDEPGNDDGGNAGPGSPNSGPGGDDDGGGANCTTADLTPGAVVQEAELEVAQGVATFEEVELAG